MTHVTLSADCGELLRDIERIELGDLSLPTVSAVRLICAGREISPLVIYLDGTPDGIQAL